MLAAHSTPMQALGGPAPHRCRGHIWSPQGHRCSQQCDHDSAAGRAVLQSTGLVFHVHKQSSIICGDDILATAAIIKTDRLQQVHQASLRLVESMTQ